MTRIGRLTAQLGITAVLATALSFILPIYSESANFNLAVWNYSKNPSSENAEILRVESAKKNRFVVRIREEGAGLLFIVLNIVWFVVRRRTGKSLKSA